MRLAALLVTLALLAIPTAVQSAPDAQCLWADDPSISAESTWALVDLADGTPTVQICTPFLSTGGFRYAESPYPVTSCTLKIGATEWTETTTKPGEFITIAPTSIVFTPVGSNTGEVWCNAGAEESVHVTIGMVIVPVSEPPTGPFQVAQ